MFNNLVPLVCAVNETYPVDYARHPNEIKLRSNTPHDLIKMSDTIIFNALIIQCHVNLNLIRDITITIRNKNNDITNVWIIPFDMIRINNTNIIDNEYFVTIKNKLLGFTTDKKLLIKDALEIPVLAINEQRITFIMNSVYDFDFELLVESIFYQDQIRRLIYREKIEQYIYQYQQYTITQNTTVIKSNLMSIGVYIKISDMITKLSFCYCSASMLSLSKRQIDYYRYLINKKVLWSKEHSETLRSVLESVLPVDILFIIEQYAKSDTHDIHDIYDIYDTNDKCEYLYYVPFSLNDISNSGINLNSMYRDGMIVKIETANNTYDGKIWIKCKNVLLIENNTASVMY